MERASMQGCWVHSAPGTQVQTLLSVVEFYSLPLQRKFSHMAEHVVANEFQILHLII